MPAKRETKKEIKEFVNARLYPYWDTPRAEAYPVEEIAPHLKSSNHEVRMAAAYLLGQTKKQAAIPHLKKALEDKEKLVRHYTVYALNRIGGPEALRLTATALADKEEMVYVAAQNFLEKAPGSKALPALAEMFGHEGWQTRKQAVELMEKIMEKLKKRRLSDRNTRAYRLVQQHLRPDDEPDLKLRAIRAAIQGKVNEKNARLYVKELRALEGSLK